MGVEFRLLGQVEADVDGRPVDLGHARQCCVLAVLLVDAGRVVPVDTLLDRVWAGQPPRRARVTLSGYVSRLRKMVPENRLRHEPGGYRLDVDPMTVDLHRFRGLVAEAAGADEELLTRALELWRGEPFGTLDTPWLAEVRDALAAERLAAELDRNDLALARGRHTELLAGLTVRAAEHPLDERLAGQLMLAFYRCGRQADALHHYDRLRLRLADELGADPSPPLRQLHQRILTVDATLTAPSSGSPVPRQLPAPAASFAGRVRELAHLDGILTTGPSTVVISAVSGTAGVGKTALALRWAHRVAERFADGQLYVNLRGFDPGGSVMSPDEAIRGFLDAFDVPPRRIPTSLDAQAALYRSLLAGRRMMVVLDNARDVEQVRPLLPGTSGSLVLVTSRSQLTGLVAGQGAQPLVLDVLDTAEARELLVHRVGADRVAAEPDAVDEIITRCARLPLALAIVAARAATHPTFPLRALAAELHDSRGRLDTLAGTDPFSDARAVFSWSYQALGPAAARLFRLLGLHPGPDITAAAAASLAAAPVAQTRSTLAELTRAHLLTEHVPGRYTFHDLLRAYATEQANTHDTAADRRAATRRMLDHYLHTAHTATQLIHRYIIDVITLQPAGAGVTPEHLGGPDEAMGWFAAEHPVIVAAIHHVTRGGFESYAWQLVWVVEQYLARQGYWHWCVLRDIYGIALDAAQQVGDQAGTALAHLGLGGTHLLTLEHDEAMAHLRRAVVCFTSLDDRPYLAVAHHNLAVAQVKLRQGRAEDALDHAGRSLELFRTIGNQGGQTYALTAAAWSRVWIGDYHPALADCQQALALHRELATPDVLGQAYTWDSLGYVHHHLGHHDEALESYQCALDLFREHTMRDAEAESLTRIGDTHAAAGNPAAANTAWRQALDILTEIDHPGAPEVRARLSSAGPGYPPAARG